MLNAVHVEDFMKLNYRLRASGRKSDSRSLRCQGAIPAIVYSRGQHSINIAITASDYEALVRNVRPGHLSTQIFTLLDENGKEIRAILKEIQYEPTTYKVIHLDFEELVKGHKVNIKVPIEWVGAADCVGVKLGGVLRAVIRYLHISCLPDDIPQQFTLDVRNMGPRESKRLKELEIPPNVRPLVDLNEVAVVVAKR